MRGTSSRPPVAIAALLAALASVPSLHAQDDAAQAPAPAPSAQPSATPSSATQKAESASERRELAMRDAQESLQKSSVPKPIERARFAAFLAAIDPALPMNAGILEAYAAYSDSIEKQNESSVRQIVRLLPAAYTYDAARESFEPRATPELVALLALRDKVQRSVTIAERKLFDSVEAAVPSERKPQYARALLALRSEQAPKSAILASTRVSLLDVLPRVKLSPEKALDIEATITPYATTLAKALADRSQIVRANESARAIAEVAAGTLWRFAPEEISGSVDRQLVALDERDFASELAVRDAHFEALGRLRIRLDARDGRRLVELWQQLLHPSLFEDERILARIVEETLAHPAFTPDHDSALIDAVETGYQRLEPLSRKLCENADLVLPRLESMTQEAMLAEIEARLAIIETQHRRREIIKEILQRVRGMIGDADAAMAVRIEDAIGSIDSLERADSFEERSLTARAGALAEAPSAPAPKPSAAPGITEPQQAPGAAPPAQPKTAPSADEPTRNGRGSRGSRRNGEG